MRKNLDSTHCVMRYLYDDYDIDTTNIDKIEVYTLPPNSLYSCRYLYNGSYHTEEDITDDKPFVAVYFSTKNRFGIGSSNVIVHYFRNGFDETMELLQKNTTTPRGILWNFPGGVGGWATGLLYGTIKDGFPWSVSELDVDYIVKTYDPSTFDNKKED